MLAEDVGRRRIGEGLAEAEALSRPRTIRQSGRASLAAAARNARWREMRRSELVTVPSFSPQAAAGSTMRARRDQQLAAHFGDDEQIELASPRAPRRRRGG